MSLLEVTDLETHYRTDDGKAVHGTDGISFSLEENQALGLVGESGSGKTTAAKSLIKLLPRNGDVVGGTVRLKDMEITDMTEKEIRRKVRWREISMIPQSAMNGLDPVRTVGSQIVQAIQTHEDDTSRKEARERAKDLFERLGLEPHRIDDYPHQFSGGMAQRAMIALALAVNPSVILADEPTTALDVVIQDRILEMMSDIREEMNSSMVLITHDMSVVSESCDKTAVMYAGRIVEYGETEDIIKDPLHPYTQGLRNSFPDITKDDQDLISIPGNPPDLIEPEDRCQFAPRCPFAQEECWEEDPEPREIEEGHYVECHRADEKEYLQEEAAKRETWLGDDDEGATDEPAAEQSGATTEEASDD